jgi:hypothetical protein
LELSSRYEWKNNIHSDNLPPGFFITFVPNRDKGFAICPEYHYNLNSKKRVWPSVGEYRISEVVSGFGAQCRYHHKLFNNLYVRGLLGVGTRFTGRRLKTNNSTLQQYVAPPINDDKQWYYYAMLGLETRLHKQWHFTLDGGTGFQWVSIGIMYTFKDEPNE